MSAPKETVKGRVQNILSKLGANDRHPRAMIEVSGEIIDSSIRLERLAPILVRLGRGDGHDTFGAFSGFRNR